MKQKGTNTGTTRPIYYLKFWILNFLSNIYQTSTVRSVVPNTLDWTVETISREERSSCNSYVLATNVYYNDRKKMSPQPREVFEFELRPEMLWLSSLTLALADLVGEPVHGVGVPVPDALQGLFWRRESKGDVDGEGNI